MTKMNDIAVVPTSLSDAAWVEGVIKEAWGSSFVVVHDTVYHPHTLPGFKAVIGNEVAGLLTYHVSNGQCEVVTLNSLVERVGVGTALIETIKRKSQEMKCGRLWVRTTNDNLAALGFYQRRGFSLVFIDREAVERSRKLKPSIPSIGDHGIPLRDEIELELMQ